MKHTFICEEHREFGERGWRLESQPGFDPLGGMAVAHDCLEHFPDTTDSPSDEFQALGASLWIRGDSGYWERQGIRSSPGENIASDLPDIFRHIFDERMTLGKAPRSMVYGNLKEHLEEYFDDIKDQIERFIKYGDIYCCTPEDVANITSDVFGWMAHGYARARRRYKGHDPYSVCCLFRQIEEAADKALVHANEGDKLEVSVVLRRSQVTTRLIQPMGWYY